MFTFLAMFMGAFNLFWYHVYSNKQKAGFLNLIVGTFCVAVAVANIAVARV
jgi:hypothetical protein